MWIGGDQFFSVIHPDRPPDGFQTSGSIPKEIGRVKTLCYLFLQSNKLEGESISCWQIHCRTVKYTLRHAQHV